MAEDVTAGRWSIYRNLIDQRLPTAALRPRHAGDTQVWADGIPFKSREGITTPDGPYDLFHNTFLVMGRADQPAAYTQYRQNVGQGPHVRNSFNNIFVVVDSDATTAEKPIAFLPRPTFPGPTDGNLYYRIGPPGGPVFTAEAYTIGSSAYGPYMFKTLDELWHSPLFTQSQATYPPGYEAHSFVGDPHFQNISPDGSARFDDDLRLLPGSPAAFHAVPCRPTCRC
jgi:hypothetical protein